MGHFEIITLVFVAYMVVLFCIGLFASTRTKTGEDFFLGGRTIGTWVTAISSTASSESGWAIIGTVGMVYQEGLSAAWFMPGCLLGYWINWRFIARRMRSRAMDHNALTIPDFLEAETGSGRNLVRLVAVLIIFFSMMAYVASQCTAIGKSFVATYSVSYGAGVLIGSSIVICYTLLGGYRAVAWTDFFQGMLMVFGMVVLPSLALLEAGGASRVVEELSSIPGFLSLFKKGPLYASLGSAVGLLGIGLGYPGQPHVLTRYMGAVSTKALQRGKAIAIGWGVIIYGGAVVGGLSGRVLFPGLADQEHLFLLMADKLLHPALTGLMMAAVMAAIMSTVSSQLLVASSSVVRDGYEKIFHRRVGEKRLLLISRISVLLLGAASVLVSLTNVRLVFWFVLYAWSVLGASFGPLVIFLLYGYRFTPRQAVAGMLLGFVITVTWKASGLSAYLYEIIPAFGASFIYLWSAGKKQP